RRWKVWSAPGYRDRPAGAGPGGIPNAGRAAADCHRAATSGKIAASRFEKLTAVKPQGRCPDYSESAARCAAPDNNTVSRHRRNQEELPMPPSDIEIAQQAKMLRATKVAEKLGIPEEHLIPYGHYKAKVSLDFVDSLNGKKNGKLILVTAISPTPAGEGKTTTTVGLGDALN